jgi:hypothetical protein
VEAQVVRDGPSVPRQAGPDDQGKSKGRPVIYAKPPVTDFSSRRRSNFSCVRIHYDCYSALVSCPWKIETQAKAWIGLAAYGYSSANQLKGDRYA